MISYDYLMDFIKQSECKTKITQTTIVSEFVFFCVAIYLNRLEVKKIHTHYNYT